MTVLLQNLLRLKDAQLGFNSESIKSTTLETYNYQLLNAQHPRPDAGIDSIYSATSLDSAIVFSAFPRDDRMSTGNGNTTVVFFSAPISTSVCRYRS